jgi:hypothetical protein
MYVNGNAVSICTLSVHRNVEHWTVTCHVTEVRETQGIRLWKWWYFLRFFNTSEKKTYVLWDVTTCQIRCEGSWSLHFQDQGVLRWQHIAWPWGWWHYDPYQQQQLLQVDKPWHPKRRNFINTAVIISYLWTSYLWNSYLRTSYLRTSYLWTSYLWTSYLLTS